MGWFRVIRWVAIATVLSVPAALTPPADASAATVTTSAALASADATTLGSTVATSAGSCWEIKQLNPAAADGDYWLLTPAMSEPQQFYCDMTTDGGGWVLVGKGRNDWDKNINPVGSASSLLSPETTPMSSTAVQLAGSTVDGLLNNGRVDALSDGIRLRRAKDTAGTSWQEVRMRMQSSNHWTWALGALYPLASWSFDGATGSGGTSQNFGSNQSYNRVANVPGSSNNYSVGFAYGSGVSGTNSSTSYLWSPNNGGGAIPYTQVYLRPHVTSSDAGFSQIPSTGTKAYSQPSVADSNALQSPWGVAATAGSTSVEGSVQVQAFTQSGDNMYVGGNFRYVQQDASGAGQVQQPFLAAFNVNTGQWVSSFRPQLNEQVRTLATLPNGDVVAGGVFSQANGQAASGIVALNPSTGATDPSWRLTIQNLRSGGVTQVDGLTVFGNYLYIGGSFTHMTGGTVSYPVYTSNLGRVSVTDATPSTDWNGDLNGTVNDVSGGTVTGQPDRMYAAGYFTQRAGVTTQDAAAFETTTGAPLATPAWNPVWSNSNSYQRAIKAVGSKVWVGGSEHDLFQFDTTSFDRVLGDIMLDKGDIQSITEVGGNVYAGCHCNYFDYQNAYAWPTLTSGWTRADGMNWFGAWNENTGARVPQFAPHVDSSGGAGIWALSHDSNGVLWAGGDIDAAATATRRGAWAGGFARFAPNDSSAPNTPGNFRITSQTASTVTLAWSGVSDTSGVRYQILRDDRPIATTTSTSITVPLSDAGRYFVRAADGAGNLSASTSVLVAGTGVVPPSPSFTWTADHSTVSLDASGSSAPSGASITDYLWDFGDGSGRHGVSASHSYAAAGTYPVTLTVTSSEGATATATQAVTVQAPATNPTPSDTYGKHVYDDGPWAYYRLGDSGATSDAADSGPDARTGRYVSPSDFTFGVAGALANSTDTAVQSSGSGGFIVSPKTATSPSTFSIGVWFKTTSTAGGRLIGYSSSNTGLSTNYDRHIYMQNSGQLVFGVWSGQENEVVSPQGYNDGNWHQAVATMSQTDGMRLYVDGQEVGTNTNTDAENVIGYWKVGGDHVWEGASSNFLNGSLDEAVVYNKLLTTTAIADQYTGAVTPGSGDPNNPPTASFTAVPSNLSVQVDASASADADGTIASYLWDFGDGATGHGQVTNHTYDKAGTYTVKLTVTDNDGAQSTTSKDVHMTTPPVESVAIANGSAWAWRYENSAPAANWNEVGFDTSAWAHGAAVLGFGSSTVTTNIDTFSSTSDRPAAAYFVHSFTVDDASKVARLVLNTVADDGVIIYVNGTEVNRTNMSAGGVNYKTYASAAVRTAKAPEVTVDVPTSLLVDGTNVVAVETHLNYRATPDASFDLKATVTTSE